MKLEAKRLSAKGDNPLEKRSYLKLKDKFESLKIKYFEKSNDDSAEKSSKVAPEKIKQFDPNKRPYIYSFITMRSMDGVELLENAYKEFRSPTFRCCIKFWSLAGCCKENYRRVKLREIDNAWPTPEIAILPDNINW